jgi:1,2-dihydroxy-3-keto-5-methylthiopentene dioxygenase
MRAYYYDNVPGDQRLHHDSGRPVEADRVHKLGLFLRNIPLDTSGGWEHEVDNIAEQQGCKYHDTMDITKEGLGDMFETMLEKYFTE